ncbi:helix-turn-helix domain-containing protein [Streptomyces albidoflavus]|uniref:Helix-turn-helix transcriptional regulator n=3 Tax=Streptomyces TaxID=1883 RepID=A0ACC7Y741_9ACTN|nr:MULTISPECIES: XRE family transcriptional regulator [Streptomyces]MYQ74987.1 helix-turn-helix domain-containing protein [Streptomyces sp. SID4934]MYW58416.1 helix-turn-helix domain-containing protein [Streptomyces sp. SID8370]MYW83337.1 helix-turn-helix domain-containing protein [Streptomyces sp. SID8371]MYX49006.1 helix-turn-helix domain-containing protein [Streptomyces sp. SID8385]NUW10597.1 helix-turn-helix transcriptional regulator [Streptomyces sp. CAI-21]SCD96265.1 transcriptional reg
MDEKVTLRVGPAVRRRRRALELTLAAVAERSGLSVPFLSQVENQRARPSLRSLEAVADALETTAVELMDSVDPAHTVEVVRAGPESPGAKEVRTLIPGHHQLEALEFTGDHDEGREQVHRNDELLYVVEGSAEVEAEGRAHRLGKGDTLYLTGGVRHRWRATGPDTRILVITVADHVATDEDTRD